MWTSRITLRQPAQALSCAAASEEATLRDDVLIAARQLGPKLKNGEGERVVVLECRRHRCKGRVGCLSLSLPASLSPSLSPSLSLPPSPSLSLGCLARPREDGGSDDDRGGRVVVAYGSNQVNRRRNEVRVLRLAFITPLRTLALLLSLSGCLSLSLAVSSSAPRTRTTQYQGKPRQVGFLKNLLVYHGTGGIDVHL